MYRISISVPPPRASFAIGDGTSSYLGQVGKPTNLPEFNCKNTKPNSDDLREDGFSRDWKNDKPLHSHPCPRTTLHRPGILVVDDDIATRTMLTAGLWRQGFTVWLAGSGLQAIELYSELLAEIDIALLTVDMPEMDGPQTLVALQKFNPEICCCFLVGDFGQYTEKELLERGAVCVFQKPLSLPKLAYQLRQLVNSPKTQRPAPETHGKTEECMTDLYLG